MTDILAEKVLVLNRSWRPINIITVRKAVIMVYLDIARLVDAQTFVTLDFSDWKTASEYARKSERRLRTGTFSLRVPEVIVLSRYNGYHSRQVKFNRRNIFIRDKFRCQYCGRQLKSHRLTLDHVVPRSRGGKAEWENIVVACYSCNVKKGNRTPKEAGMELMRRPRKPRWEEISIKLHADKVPASWEAFLSEIYWDTELLK